jgi:hypothetical protein
LSWPKNPAALAGHHLNVLIEMWLAGVPIRVDSEHSLPQPTERRYTPPLRIKRALAQIAVDHVSKLHTDMPRTSIEQALAWSRRRAPPGTLRRRRSAF